MTTRHLLVSFGLLLASLPASAATLISNLPLAGNQINNDFAIANNLAAGFSLASGTDYNLTSATLALQVFPAATSVQVTLYGGSSTAPSGLALVTFTNPSFGSGAQSYAFTPTSAFTLVGGSNYWLVLEGDGSTQNSVTWNSNAPGVTATGIATFLGQTTGAGLPPTTAFTGTNRWGFQIDGDPITTGTVPEPSTYVLITTGLGAFFLRRSRQ